MDHQKLPSTNVIPEGMEVGLRDLAAGARKQRYSKGALIVQEGDAGSHVYILLQGSVKAFSMDDDGREITYATYRALDYFGEMILDGGVRSSSVTTLEPSDCAVVPIADLTAYLQRDPLFSLFLIKRLITRARAASAAARSMALESAYERLVRVLIHLAGNQFTSEPLEIRDVSHLDLAGWIGTSREMVTRLLNDLEKGGYVETGVRRIVLHKKLPARW